MLSKRIPTILPDMNYEEILETTKIHSIAGLLSSKEPIINNRPFRSPHHTITKSALIGGGKIPKPGEISLAHNGVLFLDELTEFDKSTLELLREPLEENSISINRISGMFKFPANFMMIAATNPCPCGYYGSKNKECKCTKMVIDKYLNKISGPFLDRVDLHIEVNELEYSKVTSNKIMETSRDVKNRVDKARKVQFKRYRNEKISSNSELTVELIEQYCKLNSSCEKIMKNAFERLNLTVRGYYKIIKIARTIADLEFEKNISEFHIAEAIQYRNLDKKYWKRDE